LNKDGKVGDSRQNSPEGNLFPFHLVVHMESTASLAPFIFNLIEKTRRIKAVHTSYFDPLAGSAPFSPILGVPNGSYFPTQTGFGPNKGCKPLLSGPQAGSRPSDRDHNHDHDERPQHLPAQLAGLHIIPSPLQKPRPASCQTGFPSACAVTAIRLHHDFANIVRKFHRVFHRQSFDQ
jgi:hypothetical protein